MTKQCCDDPKLIESRNTTLRGVHVQVTCLNCGTGWGFMEETAALEVEEPEE